MSSTHAEDNGEGASAPLQIEEPADVDLSDVDDPLVAQNADRALLEEEDFLSEDAPARYV